MQQHHLYADINGETAQEVLGRENFAMTLRLPSGIGLVRPTFLSTSRVLSEFPFLDAPNFKDAVSTIHGILA